MEGRSKVTPSGGMPTPTHQQGPRAKLGPNPGTASINNTHTAHGQLGTLTRETFDLVLMWAITVTHIMLPGNHILPAKLHVWLPCAMAPPLNNPVLTLIKVLTDNP